VSNIPSIYGSFLGADGTGAASLYGKHCYEDHPFGEQNHAWESEFPGKYEKIIQDGKEVYKFAVKALPFAAEKAAVAAGLTLEDIDIFIPHQANLRIIQAAAKTMEVSMERFYVNIENHGNTSGVTIPLALYEGVKSGRIKRGDKICLVGFGAGLTFGSIVFEF
jgi:3-oxoacyl-[acyl-carrier-protein] synthase-3